MISSKLNLLDLSYVDLVKDSISMEPVFKVIYFTRKDVIIHIYFQVVPSLRCVPTSKTVFPKILQSEWVAPNSTVIGNVETHKFSSLYHGTILRGDTCKITIGKGSIIQDNTILHNGNYQTKSTAQIKIGDHVIIGVNCKINSCIIEDNAFIGNGATIHEGSRIESGAMIAAGAVVEPNTVVPANQVKKIYN